MNKEDQYLELCGQVKCTLAPSPIHGIGVFALRDIQQGERLYVRWTEDIPARWYTLTFTDLAKFDKVYPEIKQIILDRWPSVVNGAHFMSPNYDARLSSFLNHADNPNYDILTDTAIMPILKGQEVTEDYRKMKGFEKVYSWLVAEI